MSRSRTPSRGRSRVRKGSVMRTPNSNQRKRVKVSHAKMGETAGADHNDKAQHHVAMGLHIKEPRHKFSDSLGNAPGFYSVTRYTLTRQNVLDQWALINYDINNNEIEFFTPRKIKDAEGILFNGKTATDTGYTNQNIGANANLGPGPLTFIKDSWVQCNFRNVSQHNCTVEMYICYGRTFSNSTFALAYSEYNTACDMYQGNSASIDLSTLNIDPLKNEVWNKAWRIIRHTFKFEPGEKSSFRLQGPRNVVWEGQKHLFSGTSLTGTSTGYLPPNIQGNGCQVFFRHLNDLTLQAYSIAGTIPPNSGGRRISPHHPINPVPASDGLAQGGVLIEMKEGFMMRNPEGLTSGPQRTFLNVLGSVAGATIGADVEIDADDSGTVPTVPL